MTTKKKDTGALLHEERDTAATGTPWGDEVTFEANSLLLRRYLSKRLRNDHECDDYIQEVWARVLALDAEKRSQIRDWRGFLTRVASNILIDSFRRKNARNSDRHVGLDDHLYLIDDNAFDPERIALSRARVADVEGSLARLDTRESEALVQARVHGLSHADIGKKLGLTSKQVSHLIERALVKISRDLARSDDPSW